MLKSSAIIATSFAFAGCASVVNDSTHPMKVETKTAAGEIVAGAECKLTNGYGSISVKSGDTTLVRRSNTDMDIVCKHPANPEGNARVISRANAGMFGNVIAGGAIGAIIDHNKGTAYTYPTWVQLVFGRTLVFDRAAEEQGRPALGTEPVSAASK
jgi:hypothetical protein